jgi:type I restriction enzyme S subunit
LKPYSKYKALGIEWLERAPEQWGIKKLKYVAKLRSGESITSDDIRPSGEYPVYGGNGLRGYSDKFTHEGEYVLIGRQGALCGNVNYASGKFWASEHAVVALPLAEVSTYWLGELLRSMNLNQYNQAAAQPGLSVERIENLSIPFPNYSEQVSIATFLDDKTKQIDTLIEKKRKLIGLLKEERQAVINHAVTKGLDLHAKMKPSGIEWLGDVPVGWEVKKLKYLVSKIGSGVTPSGGASVYQSSGIIFLRSQNIQFDRLLLDDVAYVTTEIDEAMSRTRVRSGDVLLNITGASIGRTYYWDGSLGAANVNQHVCIIRPTAKIGTRFLHFFLWSNAGQTFIDVEQTGANREGLNFDQIAGFGLPLPDSEEQGAIVAFLDQRTMDIALLIEKAERGIELLAEYRTALVTDVVTGKVDVSEYAK